MALLMNGFTKTSSQFGIAQLKIGVIIVVVIVVVLVVVVNVALMGNFISMSIGTARLCMCW